MASLIKHVTPAVPVTAVVRCKYICGAPMLRWLLVTITIFLAGCSRHRHTDPPRQSTSVPDISTTKTADSLHQLLLTPVVNDAPTIPAGNSLREITVRDTQLLAADGHRYTMFVSDDDQLVWIKKTGGIGNHINEVVGPWSINNQYAVALLAEIAEREVAVENNRSNEQ